MATLIGAHKNYGTAYPTIAVIALVGNILPLVTRIPRKRQNVSEHLGEVAGQHSRSDWAVVTPSGNCGQAWRGRRITAQWLPVI